MKIVIRNYIVRQNTWNRNFVIVQNEDGWYLAIEDKYLDENGCLTEKLNGWQMHADKSLKNCLEGTRLACRIDALREHGKSSDEIMDIIKSEIMVEKEVQ